MAHHCRPLIPGERARSRSSADYDFACTVGTKVVLSGTGTVVPVPATAV